MNSHSHTVYSIPSNGKKVPRISLSGQWLERCGFKTRLQLYSQRIVRMFAVDGGQK